MEKGLQSGADFGRRAAQEAARRMAEEAAFRAAQEAVRQAAEAARRAAMAGTGAKPSTTRPTDQFARAQTRGPDLTWEGSAPAASTLRTENRRDSQANCLDLVGDRLAADPALRSGADVVFLRDTRPGAEGNSGHVVIRRGNEIWDPASEAWKNTAAFLRENPQYQVAGMVGGEAMHRVLSAPPGRERDAAIAAAGIDPSLVSMPVADTEEASATNGVQQAGMPLVDLAANPALQAAADAYISNPSEGNYDTLVQQAALAQAQGARGELNTLLQQLQSDPQAWQTLCEQGFELNELTTFMAQGAELEAMLPQLQQWAALRDPSMASVTMDQLLADPALCDRFLRAAETGAIQGSSNPGQPVPFAAPEPLGPVPQVNDFRALMNGDPHVPGQETGFRERAAAVLAPGMAYSQAETLAEQRIQQLVAENPALAVMPAWRYAQPTGGATSISIGPGGITVPPLSVAPRTDAALQPLRDRIAEVDTLLNALRTQSPSAADLLLATPLATQALLQTLMAMPDDDPRLQQAWDAVLASVDRSQTLQLERAQSKQTDRVLDTGLMVASLVLAGAAFFATGGLAAGLLVTSFAVGGVQGARDIGKFQQEEYLSQFNAGGALDFSGVQNPSDLLFAAGMLMNAVGMAFDAADLFKLMRAAGVADDTVEAARAGFNLADTADTAVATELRQAASYGELSPAGRQFLEEWIYPTASAEAKDALFQVWRQTVGHPDGARSLQAAYAAGDVTAQQVVLWSTRGSSIDDSMRIVNMVTRSTPPSLTPAQLQDFRAAFNVPATLSDAQLAPVATALYLSKFGRKLDDAMNVVPRTMQELAQHIRKSFCCGDVSRLVYEELSKLGLAPRRMSIGGEASGLTFNGTQFLGDGGTASFHFFVVDDAGKVWDPITGVWGDMSQEDYVRLITDSSGKPLSASENNYGLE